MLAAEAGSVDRALAAALRLASRCSTIFFQGLDGRVVPPNQEELMVHADGRWSLVSDHLDWPDEPWPDDAAIFGEVKRVATLLA